jgi:hypothetical protein
VAKKTYKLLRFDGGINNDADPRDIGDNQFADLQNVAVDEMGKIIILGDIQTGHKTLASSITAHGTSLKAIKTDYDGLLTGSADVPGQAYWLVENGAAVQGIGEDGESATIAVSSLAEANMYYIDGALRIYDGDHNNAKTNSVTPQWRGYIPGVLYGTDDHGTHVANKGHIWNSGGSKADTWYTESAQIKGCFEEVNLLGSKSNPLVGKNLLMGSGYVQNASASYIDGSVGATELFAFANELCGTSTGAGTVAPTNYGQRSGMYWGHSLGYYELTQGGTGGWAPTGAESYQFWCTTIYDGTQESLPQMFSMYPTGPQAVAQRTAAGAGSGAPHLYGPEDESTPANNSYTSAKAETSLRFGNETNIDAVGTSVPIVFLPRIKWCDAAYDTGTNWSGSGDSAEISGIYYNFGAVDGSGNPDAGGTGAGSGNPRITGLRVYWASSEDGWSDLWQLYEWDFVKGIKAIGSTGGAGNNYNPVDFTSAGGTFASPGTASAGLQQDYWYQHTHGRSGTYTNGMTFNDPPKYIRYDATNGHSASDTIIVDSFKASVVSNGRVYIGNVQIDGKVYSDRMIRSGYHLDGSTPDKFPMNANNIDVATHDGDEIIALFEYADRVLQFKRNTCYIINVSGAKEYLEVEHKFKGVTNPGAVCRTDYGIAWANQNGCYWYDGKSVLDLLEDKGMRKINQSTWSTFIGTANYNRIGFNPFKRQLIVLQGTTGNDAYVYDMVTKSWTFSSNMNANGSTKSNFINDPIDGTLLIHDGSSTIDKWVDTPTSNPNITITTKDIDFGEPAVGKKVYKVYITYKCNTSTLPTVYYDTDGNTTLTTAATAVTAFTDTNNQWTRAEYKFGTDTNSCKSIQLKISGTSDTTFAINDISFVYRAKGVK